MSNCEACGGAGRYIDAKTGKCSSCGHVQGTPIDRSIWLGAAPSADWH